MADKTMRRSALIGPWGVGAIVPFPDDESLMIAGLDMWRYEDPTSFIIKDERLQRRLGVKELRWPPDYREHNADRRNCHLTIPAVRFPRWHYCPYCGGMEKTTLYQQQPECDCYPWPNGRKCNPSNRRRRKLIPERFILICPNGHIDDFPVAEWLHEGTGHVYDPVENGGKCKIRRSTGGASASLSGIFYECSCGARKSIAGAQRPGALAAIGYKCKGAKPWLGIDEDRRDTCLADTNSLQLVLRGATNVWFADTRSSIYIPTEDESSRKIITLVDRYYDELNSYRVNGAFDPSTAGIIARANNVDPDEFFRALVKRSTGMEALSEEMSEDAYRQDEYERLVKSCGGAALPFHSINHPIDWYDPVIRKYFKSISLIHKLQETRAFVGFSRVDPRNISISERKKLLRLGKERWLPAIQVQGEGIFFEFNREAVEAWAEKPEVQTRVTPLREAYRKSWFSNNEEGVLRSEFLLIHTFAHLIINQLSFECGYGSSSIRERLYCEKTSNEFGMYGVLIYTASGDSEGSLGGLVRLGEKNRVEDTICNAIRNAAWCSSDPVCIQSLGQGPESCNLAACHNCALLPETCCECGNRLLDRGVIVGDLKNKEIGFFSDLCNP